MSTLTSTVHESQRLTHPFVMGALGAVVYATAMAAGEALDLNGGGPEGTDPATTTSEWIVTGGIAAVGLVVALGLGVRAWNGDLRRLSRTAVGLAVAGAALFVVFWAGWSNIFAAVAFGLALEHRRRIGSFGTGTALVAALAAVTSVVSAYICVTG